MESTLSFVTKKPKIAEVIPGHSANSFTSREYDLISILLQRAVLCRLQNTMGL